MSAIIVAGFPGVGKSEYTKNATGRIADLEPTPFKYGKNQEVSWPTNYLDAIHRAMKESDLVLITSDPEIIKVLIAEGVHVTVVYPDKSQRAEYKQRYLKRGNNRAIVDRLDDMFDSNVDNLAALKGCKHVILQPSQYLSDVAKQIH